MGALGKPDYQRCDTGRVLFRTGPLSPHRHEGASPYPDTERARLANARQAIVAPGDACGEGREPRNVCQSCPVVDLVRRLVQQT
jgi:hypothetical protein